MRWAGRRRAAVIVGLFTMCGAPASAADTELGRYLSSECMTCHGAAQAQGAIPDIFGMPESRFADRLKAYRDKRLDNEAMQTVAARLRDEDIAALAAYFATARR